MPVPIGTGRQCLKAISPEGDTRTDPFQIVSPSGLAMHNENEIRCLTTPAMNMPPSGLKKRNFNGRAGLGSELAS